MKIPDLLGPADIHLDVGLSSKKEVLQFLSELVKEKCGLPAGECRHALASRERLGPTTIGSGVAFPHAHLDNLPAPFAIFLRLAEAVDYSGTGEEMVDVVVMLLTPTGAAREHLEGLAKFARALRSPETLERARSAKTPDEVLAALSI